MTSDPDAHAGLIPRSAVCDRRSKRGTRPSPFSRRRESAGSS